MNINKDIFLAKDGHPSLKQFYFIGAPFEKALEFYLKRRIDLSDFYQNLRPKLSYLNEEYSLSQKLDLLSPLEITGSSKYLLLETKSNWSLLIGNNREGTDFSCVEYEAMLWKVKALTIYLKPYFKKDEFGIVSFCLYDGSKPISRHECEARIIQLYKETSRIEFSEYGTPLPFEQTEKYNERLKKNRLTVEMVEEYCKHLGIALFDLDFYQSKAALIEILRNK